MSLARLAAKTASKQDEEKITKQALLAIQETQCDSLSHSGNTIVFTLHGSTYRCTIAEAYNVKSQDRKDVMDLLEANMRDRYEASQQGWNRREKQGELFNKSGRFIILKSQTGTIIAFVNWRFDVEDCDEKDALVRADEDIIEVVYCYEVQVKSSHRSQKLGRLLMGMLHSIALQSKMRKVMLTVFIANLPARNFYNGLGYSVDLISPAEEYAAEHEVDYVIMSKAITS